MLEALVKDVMTNYPNSSYTFEVKEQYRNMKTILDRHPEIVENAVEAIRRAGGAARIGRATHDEVMTMIDRHSLFSIGIG
jgi:hypothetical protein